MSSLKHSFGPPTDTFKGVELTTEQLAKFKMLHGTVKRGGITMMEAFARKFAEHGYDINRERIPETGDEFTSHRVQAVARIIERYRKKAGKELLRGDEALAEQVEQFRSNNIASRRGVPLDLRNLLDNLGN